MKIMSTCILRPPLQPNYDPQSKMFSRHTMLNYCLGKVPNVQYCSSKIKCVRAKNQRGGGEFKTTPPPDRIALIIMLNSIESDICINRQKK